MINIIIRMIKIFKKTKIIRAKIIEIISIIKVSFFDDLYTFSFGMESIILFSVSFKIN